MFDDLLALVAFTALLAWLNQRALRLPLATGVMVLALAATLSLAGLEAAGLAVDARARAQDWLGALDFESLLMRVMLPLLLFAGALQVDVGMLRRLGWQVGLLAFVGTAVSTALIGLALWAVSGWLGLGLPWLYCLLFGALISPTDPIAVIGMLRSAAAPPELEVVIAGESLFNDGVGVVLFTLLLGMLVDAGPPSAATAGWLLLREAGGGLLFGALAGAALAAMLRRTEGAAVQVILALAMVLGGYTLANQWAMSGALAVVMIGLIVAAELPVSAHDHRAVFWEVLDQALNAVLFTLVGLHVGLMRWSQAPLRFALAAAVVVALTLLARWLTVGLPVRLFARAFALPRGAAAILTWGGLRGGISIALALSIPQSPEGETVVALTCCVVGFAILVQGLTFARLVRRTSRA